MCKRIFTTRSFAVIGGLALVVVVVILGVWLALGLGAGYDGTSKSCQQKVILSRQNIDIALERG